MLRLSETEIFTQWLTVLRDVPGRRAILQRLVRLEATGNFGDWASVGDGLSEMRIHSGPGYRVYYTIRGQEIVLLLCGGDKDTQRRDIAKAKEIAAGI